MSGIVEIRVPDLGEFILKRADGAVVMIFEICPEAFKSMLDAPRRQRVQHFPPSLEKAVLLPVLWRRVRGRAVVVGQPQRCLRR